MENSYSGRAAVVSIVATKSGAGKTTLIESLVKLLKNRGYRVGVLKHDVKKFEIDYPGKDSHRFTEAGADSVVIASPSKLAMIRRLEKERSIEELLWLFRDEDLVIVEGFRNNPYPKIEIHRKESDKGLLCTSPQHSHKNFIAVASDEPLDIGLPVLDIDDPAEIAGFIEDAFLKIINVPNMILIGSAGRNSGKTALALELIKRYKGQRTVVAVKVTSVEGDGRCIRGGDGCGACSSLEGGFEVVEEAESSSGKDTSLLLAAGADRVFWVKARRGQLKEAMREIMPLMPEGCVIICESNSLRKVVKPGVFVMVKTEAGVMKKSAAEVIGFADLVYENNLRDDFGSIAEEIDRKFAR